MAKAYAKHVSTNKNSTSGMFTYVEMLHEDEESKNGKESKDSPESHLNRRSADSPRWKTEAHFASWLGLCPDNRISGDKVRARGTRHVLNRAATALGRGASTLLKVKRASVLRKPSPPWLNPGHSLWHAACTRTCPCNLA
jgi:hypothetical protein